MVESLSKANNMKTLKNFSIIVPLLLSLTLLSCEKDPTIEKGNYRYENQELTYINDFPVQWSDENLADEIKNTVWEILCSMTKVEGGAFVMGSNNMAYPNEMPAHTVHISDFYLANVTITQKQWKTILGENKLWTELYGKGDAYPANFISYNDALLFIWNLNYYSGLHFRMPTEAEWEYAALGGKYSQYFTYSGSNNPNEVAWSRENADVKMHVPAKLKPNELGLYDMSGNLWEWCSDYYGEYPSDAQTNPTGPSTGDKHVLRGGSFTYDAVYARNKSRNSLPPANQSLSVGLRLALEP